MGLLSKSSNGPAMADGTHPQQHDHHLGRDAALVGGAGVVAAEAHHHHEKKKLGGGLFSKRKSMDQPVAGPGVNGGVPGENPYLAGHGAPVATNGNKLTSGFGTGAGETVAGAGAAGAPAVGNTGFSGVSIFSLRALTAEKNQADHVGPYWPRSNPQRWCSARWWRGGCQRHGHRTAPVNGLNTNGVPAAANTLKDASKLDRKGTMESFVGGLLCSTSMKQKAATHHAQADHLRMQASELDEAERLEHEAGMRRQRAVGLGADPAHATGQTGFNPNGQATNA